MVLVLYIATQDLTTYSLCLTIEVSLVLNVLGRRGSFAPAHLYVSETLHRHNLPTNLATAILLHASSAAADGFFSF